MILFLLCWDRASGESFRSGDKVYVVVIKLEGDSVGGQGGVVQM